ncbi:hypothetical protein BB560_004089 [Smittium megazygosporum]|uniref:FH2 domain-containing protein n=1 Tax=Smittium megazygosporum TaxID=133381 RepID=A0A2T9ZA98_9FUNG|nr:hypothetical protein BB560_004089 [Smittium megazygosporum]
MSRTSKKSDKSIKGFFSGSDRKSSQNEAKNLSLPMAPPGSIRAFFNTVASNRNSSATVKSSDSSTSLKSFHSAPIEEGNQSSSASVVDFTNSDRIDFELEQMMHDMNLKEEQRDKMRNMTTDKKILLIQSKSQYSEFKGDKAKPGAFCRILKYSEPNTIDNKSLVHLRVCLTTQPILWVQEFVERGGLEILTEILAKISTPPKRLNAFADTTELEIIRCMKVIMNIEWGAQEAIEIPGCISTLCFSLDSRNIMVRKIAAEILTFVCYCHDQTGYRQVLKGLEHFRLVRSESLPFGAWLNPFQKSVDQQLSFLKLNASFSQVDSSILEKETIDMSVANMILVNSILSLCEDANTRISYRSMLEQSGIHDVIIKLRKFKNEMIDLQIENFETELKQDYQEMLETYDAQEVESETDPDAVLASLKSLLDSDEKSSEQLLSVIQNLILLHDPTYGGQSNIKDLGDPSIGEENVFIKRLEIVDDLVNRVGIENKIPTNLSILSERQNNVRDIINSFSNQEAYEEAIKETIDLRKNLEETKLLNAQLEIEISNKSDGLVGNLKGKIHALEDLLRVSRHSIEGLQTQNKELRKKFTERLLKQENRLKQILRAAEKAANDVEVLTAQRNSLQLENAALRNPYVWNVDTYQNQSNVALDLNKLENEIQLLKDSSDESNSVSSKRAVIEKSLLGSNNPAQAVNRSNTIKTATTNRPKAPKRSLAPKKTSKPEISVDLSENEQLPPLPGNRSDDLAYGLESKSSEKSAAESGKSLETGPASPLDEQEDNKNIPHSVGSEKNLSSPILTSPSQSLSLPQPISASSPTPNAPAADLATLFSSQDSISNISLLLPLPRKELRHIPKKKLKMLPWDKMSDREQLNRTLWLKYDDVSLKSESEIENDNILSENILRQFLIYTPTPEEKALLAAQKQNTDSLARADRFLVEMSSVFRYEKRLNVMITRLSWNEFYSDLDLEIESVTIASESVSNSKSLHGILGIILTIGNFMNGTSFRGGAYGFRVKSLTSLMDTKATDNKTTLLHFLVTIIEDAFPEFLDFLKDLKPVEKACKVSIQEMRIELNDLSERLEEAKKELNLHIEKQGIDESITEIDKPLSAGPNYNNSSTNSAKGASDNTAGTQNGSSSPSNQDQSINGVNPDGKDLFVEKISAFVQSTTTKMSLIKSKMDEMDKAYTKCSGLFGENINTMEPDEFFGIFRTFSISFERAMKDNEMEKRRKAIAEKRRLQVEMALEKRKNVSKQNVKGNKNAQGEDKSGPESDLEKRKESTGQGNGSENGTMDDLLKSLRQGNILGRQSLGNSGDSNINNGDAEQASDKDSLSGGISTGLETRKPRRRDLNLVRNSTLRRSLHRTSISLKALQMLKEIDNSSVASSLLALSKDNQFSRSNTDLLKSKDEKMTVSTMDTIEEGSQSDEESTREVTIEVDTQNLDNFSNSDDENIVPDTGSGTRDYTNSGTSLNNNSSRSLNSLTGGGYESEKF